MNQLVQTLYLFSTALLLPVIVLLFLLVLHCLLELGGLIREWRDRRSVRSAWQKICRTGLQTCADQDGAAFPSYDMTQLPGLVRVFAKRIADDKFQPELITKHADDIEIESTGRLSRVSLVIRIGPMLGLMGTLIPLGPALVGLSSGDISGMANDLVVAFSTTVLGLLVGGITYFLWLVRRQWYAQDIADIEFLCRKVFGGDGS